MSARPSSRLLSKGQPAPWFRANALSGSPTYAFDTAAGRPILMLFFGSARQQQAAEAIRLVDGKPSFVRRRRRLLLGWTVDPSDEAGDDRPFAAGPLVPDYDRGQPPFRRAG